MFEDVLKRCIEAGLVGGEGFAVEPPPGLLSLSNEPIADTERHDDLKGDNSKEKDQNLGHNQTIRVGQFSVQILGQISVQINTLDI